MAKWIERAIAAALYLFAAIVVVGMYSTWRDCTAAGGTTVRGLFGLECINQ